MCHEYDSGPPAPPRSGDVAERGVITLTAADGTALSAAYAAPSGTALVGVVILPDVRGLYRTTWRWPSGSPRRGCPPWPSTTSDGRPGSATGPGPGRRDSTGRRTSPGP